MIAKPEAENADDGRDARRERVVRNASVNLVSKVFYLATRFFLPPLTLSYVSLAEYGLWATSFILIGYLGMSAFGVSNVYVRYVAEYHARGEMEKINRLLSTGLTVVTGMCTALLAALWFALPFFIERLNVPESLRSKAFTLMFVTAAAFMLDLSFGAFSYVMSGLQQITEQTVVWVISFCLEAILIVAMLMGGFGIYALLWAFVIRYLFATAAYFVLCCRALPGLSLGLRHFDRSMLRLFYGYGAVVQLSGLLGMFLYSIEKLIAGMFIGVQATGLLDVGEKLPVMASQVPASMNSVFMPAMAQMHSLEKRDEVAALYLKGARYLNILMGAILGFLAAFSAPLLAAWIGADEKYRTAAMIMTIVCLPYQMNELTGPATAYHRGTGHPRRELVYPFTQLALVALTVALGFVWFGRTVLVICVAVAVSMVLSALIYQGYTNRYMGLSMTRYARHVLLPGVAPYALGFACAWLARPAFAWAGTGRWQTLPILGVCGIVYGLLTTGLLYGGLSEKGEREHLRVQTAQLFVRVRGLRRMPA
ncbi:MAG: oligosaccharide flippase family protein [Blastocatellia bacterium]|nr:oligosaccharide flippase family protein [Blastocatellia bacterium]